MLHREALQGQWVVSGSMAGEDSGITERSDDFLFLKNSCIFSSMLRLLCGGILLINS